MSESHRPKEGPGPRDFACKGFDACGELAAANGWMRFNCAGCSFYKATVEAKKNGQVVEAIEKKPPDIKVCVICKEPFPPTAEHFDRNKTSRDGLRSECKACRRVKQKGQKIKERDILREVRKARKQEKPEPGKIQAPTKDLPVSDRKTSIIRILERDRQHYLKEAEQCLMAIKILQGV